MTPTVQFTVLGTPTPQGSKTRMPNGAMVEGSSATQRAARADWRSSVAAGARIAADHFGCLEGPLRLELTFRFAMPKSRKAAIRGSGWCWKTSAPDLDKLVRAVGDALKIGGLVRDDSLFVEIVASKEEVWADWTGCVIRVEPLTRDEDLS